MVPYMRERALPSGELPLENDVGQEEVRGDVLR